MGNSGVLVSVVYLQMKGHDTTDHPVMLELVSPPARFFFRFRH